MSSLIGILLLATPTPSAQKSVTVDVPKVEWAEQSTADAGERVPAFVAPTSHIVVRAARWNPQGIALSSHTPQVSEFRTSLLPRVDLAYHRSVAHLNRVGTLSVIGGAGVTHLSRTGQVTANGNLRSGLQNLYLFPITVGGELKPSILTSRWAYGAISVAALPILGMSAPSTIADGQSVLGIGAEAAASVGLTLSPSWPEVFFVSYYDWAILQSSSAHGFGIGAGVKAAL